MTHTFLGGKMLPEFIKDGKFIENLKQKVIKWSGFRTYPLKAEILEEQIHNAMKENNLLSEWDAGSHKQGADIDVEDFAFSVKSGKIEGVRVPKLSISSHRTTKYKTLPEKIDFIDGKGKNYDAYFVLARQEDEKNRKRKYTALCIDADFIKASSQTWSQTNSGWQTSWNNGIHMKIQKAMSDQLWIYIEQSKLDNNPCVLELFVLEFDYDMLGKTHKIVAK